MDPDVCSGYVKELLEAADHTGGTVEIDMEHSSVGPQTHEVFRSFQPGFPQTRVAIQAAMRRSPADLASFTEVKPRIRLVNGAFLETIDKALHHDDEITAQYGHLTGWARRHLPDPAFGTHDDACIDHVKRTAEALGIDRRDYEFQMLYGVRRDVQEQPAADGYGFARTSRSTASGTRTSCDAWPSAPRTSRCSFAHCSNAEPEVTGLIFIPRATGVDEMSNPDATVTAGVALNSPSGQRMLEADPEVVRQGLRCVACCSRGGSVPDLHRATPRDNSY